MTRPQRQRNILFRSCLLTATTLFSTGGCRTTFADRVEGFRTDLDLVARELPARHPNFFFKLSPDDFEARVEQLHEMIPQLSDEEVVVQLSQLVALAGDSHTGINPSQHLEKMYPLGLYWFEDGLRVISATREYRHLIGARLIAIDRTSTDKACEKVATVVAAENNAITRSRVPQFLMAAQLIHVLGIAACADQARFSFETSEGTGAVEIIPAGNRSVFRRQVRFTDTPGYRAPVSMKDQRNKYWMTTLDSGKAIYLQYNSCSEKPLEPFDKFAGRVLDVANRDEVQKLIIDLRYNGGGNSALADTFIRHLSKHEQFGKKGHLYVLIGRRTFSSAIINAARLQSRCRAILVGEPTGGAPNHFGEIKVMTLPYSGLKLQYSTRRFNLRPGQEGNTLRPDILAPPNWQAWRQGRDPAIESCLIATVSGQ